MDYIKNMYYKLFGDNDIPLYVIILVIILYVLSSLLSFVSKLPILVGLAFIITIWLRQNKMTEKLFNQK